MKSPEQCNYQKVAELRELEDIYAGKPYLMYSPALLRQGISAELEHEIGVFCNIDDTLYEFRVENYFLNGYGIHFIRNRRK